uniref:Uncharacterized protein n=1 Tax=Plectus sambesii TaxID=2011161 RepID=A0A914XPI9_9BILA
MPVSDNELGVIFGSTFGALLGVAVICTIIYFLCFHHMLHKKADRVEKKVSSSIDSLNVERLHYAAINEPIHLIDYSSEPTHYPKAVDNNGGGGGGGGGSTDVKQLSVADSNLLNPLSIRISPSMTNIRQSTDESELPTIVSVRITPPSTSRGQLTPVTEQTDTVTLRTGAAPLVMLSDQMGNYSNCAYYATTV